MLGKNVESAAKRARRRDREGSGVVGVMRKEDEHS